MQHETHTWFSPRLDRDMTLDVYGHWGSPVMVLPCSRGRYFDYEGMGMYRTPSLDSLIVGRSNFSVSTVSMTSRGMISVLRRRIAMPVMRPMIAISWMRSSRLSGPTAASRTCG